MSCWLGISRIVRDYRIVRDDPDDPETHKLTNSRDQTNQTIKTKTKSKHKEVLGNRENSNDGFHRWSRTSAPGGSVSNFYV